MDYVKRICHTYRVIELCEEFATRVGLGEKDREILMAAAYYHDMFKGIVENKYHAEFAAQWLQSASGIRHPRRVADVVRFHCGKEFAPKEKNWHLAAILRMSDKIDKYNKEKDDADEKCKKSLKKIKKWFDEEIDDEKKWAEFKTAYEQIRDKVKQKANM